MARASTAVSVDAILRDRLIASVDRIVCLMNPPQRRKRPLDLLTGDPGDVSRAIRFARALED
jgi:hypothetical protein